MTRMWLSLFFILNIFLLDESRGEQGFEIQESRYKFLVSTSSFAATNNVSIETEDGDSEASFGSLGQYVNFHYFFKRNLSLKASMYLVLAVDVDVDVQGFDLGVEYFFLDNGSSSEYSFPGGVIESKPVFAPFVSGAAVTRDLQISSTSLKFQGLSVEVGGYYYFDENPYFVRGSIVGESLQNESQRNLNSVGATIGFGLSF